MLPPLSHRTEIQVRFGDFDMFGHINNNAYLQIFALGKALYFREIVSDSLNPVTLGMVVVNINVNFLNPTVPDEPLVLETGCIHLGERSARLGQRILNPSTGTVKCEAITTMAGFDLRTQGGAPIPEPVRRALAEREGLEMPESLGAPAAPASAAAHEAGK